MTRRVTTVLTLTVLLAGVACADGPTLRLPRIFSNHMVLQREMPVPIWGWAAPGAKVTVQFAGQEKTAQADKGGKWRVTLDPLKTGKTPRTLSVSSSIGNRQLAIGNVLVGEVWLASGQSNMERPVGDSDGNTRAIETANLPLLRLIEIPRTRADKPLDDVKATWHVCTPRTAEHFSGVAFAFGRKIQKELDVPVGLIAAAYGAAAIQYFTPAEGYQLVERFKAGKVRIGGRGPKMYNGMIHPLIPFAIRGVIWYQGESNVLGGPVYDQRMLALIRGWRKLWAQGDFPFYYVQLAPCDQYDAGLLPATWAAQQRVLSEPNTGMAVISDLLDRTELGDYHPGKRLHIGDRLSLWALAGPYGKDVPCASPTVKSVTIDKRHGLDKRLLLTFDNVYGGLKAREAAPLTHFEIAGPNGKFALASAIIEPVKTGRIADTVAVWNPNIKDPRRVRFAWHKTAQPNLMNSAGLPAGAFEATLKE